MSVEANPIAAPSEEELPLCDRDYSQCSVHALEIVEGMTLYLIAICWRDDAELPRFRARLKSVRAELARRAERAKL